MSIYLKKSIINTIIDIKKLINYILNDNTVLSPNYNKCISELYYILMKTFKKIENIYYKYILYPKIVDVI